MSSCIDNVVCPQCGKDASREQWDNGESYIYCRECRYEEESYHLASENPTKFAEVSWNWKDIKTLKPNWTKEECEKFLSDCEEDIKEYMIKHGWAIMQSYIYR